MSGNARIFVLLLVTGVLIFVGAAVWLHAGTGLVPRAVAAHIAALHGEPPQAQSSGERAVGHPPAGNQSADSSGAASGEDALTRAQRGVAELAAASGNTWNAETLAQTVRLYADVHREIEWPGLLEPESFSYGPHAQQTLTLWRPEQEFSEPSLVLLFLHGDGVHDDTANGSTHVLPGSDGLMFSHVGKLAATFGGLGVLADYRTGDAANSSSGAEDIAAMLEWIRANVAPWGGDPDTVVLLANSHGATLAASYLFDESAQLDTGVGIAVAFLSSGQFGDRAPWLRELVERYEGERVPLALWSAGFDPNYIDVGIAELYAQLCRKYGECPPLTQLQGHNHISHILSLGTDDMAAMQPLIAFYHTVR